jgi:hypothetical protein
MNAPLRLSPAQHAELLAAIWHKRVSQTPQGQSHLEQWDVRRTLTRIFGFGGWEDRTKDLSLIRELEIPPGTITQTRWFDKPGGGREKRQVPNDRPLWTVVYRAEVALTVYGIEGTSATYEDGATGDSQNQPSLGDAHDQALKTALSQALKRCAVNLGDQFGLSLYDHGNLNGVVVGTLVGPGGEPKPAGVALPKDETQVRGESDAAPPSVPDGDEAAPTAQPPDSQPRNSRQAPARPPADPGPPGETAAQRAIRERREQDRQRYAGSPAPAPAAEAPPQPDRSTQSKGDPAVGDLIDAILRATTSEQVQRLWTDANAVRPAGRKTDVRSYLSDEEIQVLADLLDAVEVDAWAGPVPVGALVVVAGRHLDAESGMSVKDHVALDTAPVDQPVVTPTR